MIDEMTEKQEEDRCTVEWTVEWRIFDNGKTVEVTVCGTPAAIVRDFPHLYAQCSLVNVK